MNEEEDDDDDEENGDNTQNGKEKDWSNDGRWRPIESVSHGHPRRERI